MGDHHPPEKPHLVSVSFVAEYLGVTEQTVRNWINKEGMLPNTIRAGRQYRILWSDVQAMLSNQYGDGDLTKAPTSPPSAS